MKDPRSLEARLESHLAAVAWIVLGLNLVLLWLLSQHKAFNPDEFEHIHIAWSMKEGGLIYRDFVDTHGALFPLVNSSLWKLLSLPDDGRTLALFRQVNLIYPALIGLATWAIAARTLGRGKALVAVAVLSTSLTFMEKAVEVRPDGPQVVCWLGCVLFMLRAVQEEHRRDAFLAGLFLGLALAANTKALSGAAAIVVYGAFELWFSRERRAWVASMGLSFAVGVVLAAVPFVLYFACRGGLWEYYFYTFPVNFLAMTELQPRIFLPEFSRFLVTHVFVLTAFVLGLRTFLRPRGPALPFDPARLLVLILIGVTVSFAISGFDSQYYLIFLPLIAIPAAHFVVEATSSSSRARLFCGVLLCVQFLVTSSCIFVRVVNPHRDVQLERLDFVLEHTAENEPVVFTQLDEAGYVFRPNFQYFWTNGDELHRFYDRIAGYSVFGERFVERLEEVAPTFIIALDLQEAGRDTSAEGRAALIRHGYSVAVYPEATQQYIAEHYRELPGLNLLGRKEALTPELVEDVGNRLAYIQGVWEAWRGTLNRLGLDGYWDFVHRIYVR